MKLFSDILSDNFLSQMVLQPTRRDSILDLVLTKYSDVIVTSRLVNQFRITILSLFIRVFIPIIENHLKDVFMTFFLYLNIFSIVCPKST